MKSILVKNKFKNGEWKKNSEKIDCADWRKSDFMYADYIQIKLDDSTVLENQDVKNYLSNILKQEAAERFCSGFIL